MCLFLTTGNSTPLLVWRDSIDQDEGYRMDYGWSGTASPHSCDYIAPAILGSLMELKPSRVIDIGCGNGALCVELAARGFCVAGVDQDQRGVQIARAALPTANFYCQSLDEAPQENGFDVAVSTEVVEHLYRPRTLTDFASKALKPGGRLIVTTPYHGYWKNLALAATNKWDAHHTVDWEGGHIKFFSRRTLEELFAKSGFVIERFSGLGRFPYLWKSMLVQGRLQLDARST